MERILLPPRYRVWERNGSYLYFDPHNFAWIKVNESGRTLLELFRRHMTLPEVTRKIARDYSMPEERAGAAVREFTDKLLAAGFLHTNAYVERGAQRFTELKFPHDIYLHLTNKCNLKCPYCYNKTDRETKIKLEKKGLVSPTMSTEEFKELIAATVRNGVGRLMFTGGEPLLRPDAMELVGYARGQSDERVRNGGARVALEMLTNATRITDGIAREMCRLLDCVTISLDGHEQHMHEAQRGKRTFGPTIDGIRRVVKARKEAGVKNPYIAIVPALTKQSIGFMREIFEFSLDVLEADGMAPIIFQAGDHQELSLSQIPELEVFQSEQKRTMDYMEERRKRLNLPPPTPRPASARNHCGVGHGEISVDPGGFVYPCQSLHFDEFICGNVRETPIEEIFEESPVMRRVRGTTVDSLPVCSHCDLKYACHGGCRATAYNVYREFDKHNEIYCKMLETMALNRLWAAAEKRPQAQ
jgi:AdoMet-dependent heme synthase